MKATPLDLEAYPPFAGFPKEGIRFLKQLKANNNREWFAAHKDEYIEFVKLPMESLLAALTGPLEKIAPEMHVDPKKCIFRIYRDTRFSKNKVPYKTHVAAIIHPKGHWEESAGLYLHIEPGEVYLGGGIYMPDGQQLKKVRGAIASKPKEFLAIVEGKGFKKQFGTLQGDRLSRAPLGYLPDHPMIEWLRWKAFFVGVEWEEKAASGKEFVRRVAEVYAETMPLVRFVNNALHGRGPRK
jgi:uncharacterized protein (TIGR02453 family)